MIKIKKIREAINKIKYKRTIYRIKQIDYY